MNHPVLSVVIPVYNEAAQIAETLRTWRQVLDALPDLNGAWECRIYNDGSSDTSGAILDEWAARAPRFVVIHQPNCGHGPTILRGYREARGKWIFQADADSEVPPEYFAHLWLRRHDGALIIGRRTGRSQNVGRQCFSAGAHAMVALFFPPPFEIKKSDRHKTPADVNCPFRLWSAKELAPLLSLIGSSSFAPNVLLAGLATRHGLPVVEIEVPHLARRKAPTRLASPLKMGLLAMRNVWELWSVALGMPQKGPADSRNLAEEGEPGSRFRWLRLALFLLVVPGSCIVWLPLYFIWDTDAPWSFGALGLTGFAPLLLGGVLFCWSVLDFLTRGHGTPAPYEPPRRLVITGPYRWSRNPMYIGVMLIALGEFLLFPSAGFAWYLFCLVLFFNLGVRFYEEPSLKRRFGPDFTTYCNRVPRWLRLPL